jgi:phage baseplate assembly protein W
MGDDGHFFLGTGWSFPPTFSRNSYSIEMVSDDLDIRQSLWVLFSTSVGERVMLPEYGSSLWQMLFRNVTTTLMTQIEEIVSNAVLYWEPRIDVDSVSVQPDASQDGLVLITLSYTIRKTNARNNLVYPFYLLEKTIPTDAP